MEVRCNRCSTEYDFDDALISERGTTVKCTHCGYQFKVFPERAGDAAPERWLVRTRSGNELVFTSLRELQRGIASRQVGPDDLLTRGQKPARPLGSIAELEPFFAHAGSTPVHTLQGLAPAADDALGPNVASNGVAALASNAPAPGWVVESAGADPVKPGSGEHSLPTLRLTRAGEVPKAADPRALPSAPEEELSLSQRPYEVAEVNPVGGALGASAPSSAVRSAPSNATPLSGSFLTPDFRSSPTQSAPNSSAYAAGPPSSSFNGAPLSAGRRQLRSYDEVAEETAPQAGRRARSRWIAAVILAGMTTLFAVTVGRRYLMESASGGAPTSTQTSARVSELLQQGNRLMDEGDFEGASEPLLRASALAENDHAVLAALAKLATLRADVTWLRLRLLDPNQTDLVQSTHRELGRRVGKARAATDAAFAVAPEDLTVQRARIDTLRLSGDADKAREWIKPIASNPSDPQNAYVLAALDLADPSPSWPGVIDRLRTAAAGERIPGRAHAALIYALARAGRSQEANSELAKLDANPSGTLLLDELRSFLKRYDSARDNGRSANVATVDPGTLGKLDTSTGEGGRPSTEAPRPSAEPPRGNEDYRRLLLEAAQVTRHGELSRASDIYYRVLTLNANNLEALVGLGQIALRRNDTAAATRFFDRALTENPGYVPALVARGDQEWANSNQSGAVAFYRRVVEQTSGKGHYGQHASARINQADGSRAAPAAPSSTETPSARPDSPAPNVDTSDLPELK
jgi:predicted Zn finger-like uncharacterized protein